MADINPAELLPLVSDIVAAHVANNKIPPAELPRLIREVYQALAQASGSETGSIARGDPAVPIKESVARDFIVCLEDGEKMKMLKRHLRTAHGMSLDQYRQRWGLAADYPMTAPNYTKARSKLAKQIGLGTTRRRKRTEALFTKRSSRSKRMTRR